MFRAFRPLWVSEYQPQLTCLDVPDCVPLLDCTQTLGHASEICLLLQSVLCSLREMTSWLNIIFSDFLPSFLTQQGAPSFLPQVHWLPPGAPQHQRLQGASMGLMLIGTPGQRLKANVSSDWQVAILVLVIKDM